MRVSAARQGKETPVDEDTWEAAIAEQIAKKFGMRGNVDAGKDLAMVLQDLEGSDIPSLAASG